jgi:hypothetical protein
MKPISLAKAKRELSEAKAENKGGGQQKTNGRKAE